MERKLRYAICDFDREQGQIQDSNLRWEEGFLEQAKSKVQKDPSKCALFFPGDVPKLGCPPYPSVARADFEKDPATYGVCFYKSWSGYVFE